MRILVVGGADQGRQVIDAVSTRADHEVIGVLDGNLAAGTSVGGVPVVGSTADLPACAETVGAEGYVVAIGDNAVRGALLEQVAALVPSLECVAVVHASAVVARDAIVGGGSILLAGSIVGNGSVVGRGVLLGTASSIDHDCELADYVSLAPGAHTAGTVRIGRASALGVGASVIHQITIGAGTVVGAGAVVLEDLPDLVVAYGVPARAARAPAGQGSLTSEHLGGPRGFRGASAEPILRRPGRPVFSVGAHSHPGTGRTRVPEESPLPDDRSRQGAGRRTQYELPSAYGSPRSAPVGAVDHDLDHDYALEDEGSVRAVHRDDAEAGPDPDTNEADAAPRSRQEYVERRDNESAPWRKTRAPRSTRRKWLWRGAIIAAVVVLVPVTYSYVNYLREPGTDSLAVRSVEWLRDHGANGVVNTIERWWYTNNPPPTGGRPDRIEVQGTAGSVDGSGGVRTPTATTAPVKYQHLPPPTNRVQTPAPVVEPNEGVWMPVGRQVGGMPAEYITFVRPDAAHTSYFTALMWLDTKLVKATYVPGLQEPGGGPNPWGSMIPVDQRGTLIAAFNSGFKMDQARGGVYFGGQEVRPLVNGAASIVIFKDGSTSVGVWGRDFTMSPDIESVRQNLELLVDNGGGPALGVAPGGTTGTGAPGTVNPAVREDDTTVFGATLGNNIFVWRSGVGVTSTGALVYAGGPAMSVLSLAKTLQNAGAVRAMELDINTDWVSAFTYRNENPADPNSPVTADKLGGDMSRPVDRYFVPGERDFFAFFADPQVDVPVTATTTTTPASTTTTTKR